MSRWKGGSFVASPDFRTSHWPRVPWLKTSPGSSSNWVPHSESALCKPVWIQKIGNGGFKSKKIKIYSTKIPENHRRAFSWLEIKGAAEWSRTRFEVFCADSFCLWLNRDSRFSLWTWPKTRAARSRYIVYCSPFRETFFILCCAQHKKTLPKWTTSTTCTIYRTLQMFDARFFASLKSFLVIDRGWAMVKWFSIKWPFKSLHCPVKRFYSPNHLSGTLAQNNAILKKISQKKSKHWI